MHVFHKSKVVLNLLKAGDSCNMYIDFLLVSCFFLYEAILIYVVKARLIIDNET